MVCRFVQKEDFRLLGQGHGNPYPSAFPTGEMHQLPIGKVSSFRLIHRPVDHPVILLRQNPEAGEMGKESETEEEEPEIKKVVETEYVLEGNLVLDINIERNEDNEDNEGLLPLDE